MITTADGRHRAAVEMSVLNPTSFSGAGKVVNWAIPGDKIIHVPAELVSYPYTINFADGRFVTFNDPAPGDRDATAATAESPS